MAKNRLSMNEYFKNMTSKPKGIKLLLILLTLIIVLPLIFGLSYLSLRSNNDIVKKSVENYEISQIEAVEAELKYDMDVIEDMLNDYYSKQKNNNLTKQAAQQLGINMISIHNMSSENAIYWIDSFDKHLVTSNLTTDNQITNRDELKDEYGVAYIEKIFTDLENGKATYNQFHFIDSTSNKVEKFILYSIVYEPWDWVITVGASSNTINQSISYHETTLKQISKEKTIQMFVIGLIFGIITFIIASYLGMSIAVNANKILDITTKMKTGDLSQRIKVYSKDELAETADSLNIALDQISELIKGVNKISYTLDTSLNNFTNNQEKMHTSIKSVSSSIVNITQNVGDQAESTVDVTNNVDGISSSIQTTVNELNILESNSNTMINYSNQSSHSLQQLLKNNERTLHDLKEMVTHTELTNDSVNKISRAAELIDDIAEQTNLLSLNASIEAARAGEHGKGFAIVASEIGALAAQSTKTVTEINSILEELNSNSSKSLEIMHEMTNASNAQSSTLEETSFIFKELKTSLDACALSIKNIALKINDIDSQKDSILANVNKLNILSEQNAASTEETSAMTEDLNELVRNSTNDINNIAYEFNNLKENLQRFTI